MFIIRLVNPQEIEILSCQNYDNIVPKEETNPEPIILKSKTGTLLIKIDYDNRRVLLDKAIDPEFENYNFNDCLAKYFLDNYRKIVIVRDDEMFNVKKIFGDLEGTSFFYNLSSSTSDDRQEKIRGLLQLYYGDHIDLTIEEGQGKKRPQPCSGDNSPYWWANRCDWHNIFGEQIFMDYYVNKGHHEKTSIIVYSRGEEE
jgi:hypothetical protein